MHRRIVVELLTEKVGLQVVEGLIGFGDLELQLQHFIHPVVFCHKFFGFFFFHSRLAVAHGLGVRETGIEEHLDVSDDRHDGEEYEGGYKPIDHCFHFKWAAMHYTWPPLVGVRQSGRGSAWCLPVGRTQNRRRSDTR